MLRVHKNQSGLFTKRWIVFTAAPQPVKEKIPGLGGTQIRPAREIPPAPEAASKPGITPNPPMCRTETDQRFFRLLKQLRKHLGPGLGKSHGYLIQNRNLPTEKQIYRSVILLAEAKREQEQLEQPKHEASSFQTKQKKQ